MKRTFFCPTSSTRTARNDRARRASGFTLIEVIVALALFVVLMVVVFVPLTQATRFMSVGRTRSELQQAANSTMLQLQRDLGRAIYIYPNDNLPGITDKLPYSTTGTSVPPYLDGGGGRVGNTSRIDMLMPELDSNGNVKYPITPAKYIVTYYARRLDTRDTTSPFAVKLYNSYTNPIVLFRAQYPYSNSDGTSFQVGGNFNADTSATRYASGTSRGLKWLTQDATGEFNLNDGVPTNATDPLRICQDATTGGLVPSNHSLAIPRNVALVTPQAPASVMPNTTFTCADTNGDGKINQVAVSLTLTNFNRQVSGDGGNDSTKPVEGNLNFQKFTLMQTIDCPNVH